MTLQEFKAWFEGFTEGMTKVPNEKQWRRIKLRVKEIDGSAITREYFYRYWPTFQQFGSWGAAGSGTVALNTCQSATGNTNTFLAMNALGRADAESLDAV